MARAILILGCVVLLAGVAAAQEPMPAAPQGWQMRAVPQPGPQGPQGPPDLGKWWKNSDIVRELQLTDAQVNQLEQAFLDHRLKLIDLHAEVERQETRLQPLLEADQLDEAKISAQLDLVLAARAKLEKQNTMMMLSLRKVLSVEQWKELQAIHHEREAFRTPPPPGAVPRTPAPAKPPRPAPPPEAPDSPEL